MFWFYYESEKGITVDELLSKKEKKQTDIANLSASRRLLKQYGLRAKKSLGQNFLVDQTVAQRIVEAVDISPDDYVFEIGPGLGALSQLLAQKTNNLALVEIDPQLAKLLSDSFAGCGNVEVIREDALRFDFAEHVTKKGFANYKLVSNLPYYITTPLLMHILEKGGSWQRLVLMVQKEVAERITATPGGKAYGALTLAVQYRAQAELLLNVPSSAFLPQPEVESAVIRLDRLVQPPVTTDELTFFRVVAAAFGKRRKTLANALTNSDLGKDKVFWQEAFTACSIDGQRRGETLSIEEFAMLANWLQKESL